ncbi:MAG: rhodanese-like domain-containing protein [Akkermansiaceae bacterium]|nr:rhodanese-like domain-containing protein [Akkermansiaceae bacterium]NNM31383.1 rhodanese-like domain-containing protein [Akkermansiaceae bacterium]
MKPIYAAILLLPLPLLADAGNPAIDYPGFVKMTVDVGQLRAERRVSESEFLRMAAEPGTVILDTRSKNKFDKLHAKGAIHLNFSDFSQDALAKLIPDRETRILIYCNNNFDGEPRLLARKSGPVALNIPTFINLHAYGYANVYELKPLLDIRTTKIPFAGSSVK